jgi:phosphoglycerate dehydrogenase-like enzyme
VGVVGLGRIGSEVAEKVRALGAKVIAHDPYVPREHARALGARLRSLPRLLREADFVTLHTSLTGSENLIDAPQLDEMRPDAYLISTGAGNAVNIDALVERLRDRRIAGAALDVYPGHMLPTTSPLMQLDNVILTPHIGGATAESVERHSRMITEDIERFLDGKRPRHVVNPDALKARRRR